jgi:branched-chain amino acid aminotransferase
MKLCDHFKVKNGWKKPRIGPLKNIELHPAAKVLHYSIELFEGMKAYMCVDGKVRLFRPDLNVARMYKSASRSALPV